MADTMMTREEVAEYEQWREGEYLRHLRGQRFLEFVDGILPTLDAIVSPQTWSDISVYVRCLPGDLLAGRNADRRDLALMKFISVILLVAVLGTIVLFATCR